MVYLFCNETDSGDTGQQKDGNSYDLDAHGDICRLAPGGGTYE